MTEASKSPIETILCAFDFSDTAEVALEQAERFAKRHRGRLVLAHVVEPIRMGPYPALMSQIDERMIVDTARERMRELADSLRSEGMEVDWKIEQGLPGPSLIQLSESVDANLIVIGTRGLTGLKRLALGSTAEYIVRRSAAPVLTVHPEDRVLQHAIETAVLPTDFSKSAAGAMETFTTLFGEWECPRVFLTYADRVPPYLEPFKHETLQRLNQPDVMKDKIEAKLAPLADRLRAADFEVEVAVLDGDPVSVVTEFAKECGADLIVMSTRGRGALLNTLLGRTAQRIVQNAPCPVLTIRAPRTDESPAD